MGLLFPFARCASMMRAPCTGYIGCSWLRSEQVPVHPVKLKKALESRLVARGLGHRLNTTIRAEQGTESNPRENTMKFHAPPDRQRRRQEMTDDIIERVREAVQEELTDATAGFSREQLEEIEKEIMSHTQQVVDALGFDEMQSEGALLSHIANARWDTGRLLWERRENPKESKTS